ncbi:retention module-containing protein, partial [Pseudomonas sp.]|uniref:retention module-containing protein n=1 Tax=Pseudomonas sp. TaxID=306 RepID=UPI003BB6177A
MATLIGVVSQVIGEVYAVAGDGTRRPLSEGDRVFVGEQIVTGAAGSIAIALSNGQQLTLGRDSSLNLTEQMLAGSSNQPAPTADTPSAAPSDGDLTDVEQLQAAIEAGVDPTLEGEATAAGPGAGGAGGAGGGGHSFVLLGETGGALDPVIGFPTEGLSSGPEFPDPEPVVADEPEVPAIDFLPSAGGVEASIDDDGLETGNAGSSAGDSTVPNFDGDDKESTFSGALVFDFGGDGPGSISFFAMDGLGATLGAESIVYSWDAATNTLSAIADDERGVIFQVVVNPISGAYTVTLLQNVLHESLDGQEGDDTENDALATLTYTVTDSNGSAVNGVLRVIFDDDMPSGIDQARPIERMVEEDGMSKTAANGLPADSAEGNKEVGDSTTDDEASAGAGSLS